MSLFRRVLKFVVKFVVTILKEFGKQYIIKQIIIKMMLIINNEIDHCSGVKNFIVLFSRELAKFYTFYTSGLS